MNSKQISLEVSKCEASQRLPGELPCHSAEAIETFISDVDISAWSLNQNINFKLYNEKPVYNLMEKQKSYLLTSSLTQQDNLFLQLNEIVSTDEFISFSEYCYSGSFYIISQIITKNLNP